MYKSKQCTRGGNGQCNGFGTGRNSLKECECECHNLWGVVPETVDDMEAWHIALYRDHQEPNPETAQESLSEVVRHALCRAGIDNDVDWDGNDYTFALAKDGYHYSLRLTLA